MVIENIFSFIWIKLRQAGYTRTIQGLYHVMQRIGIYEKPQVNGLQMHMIRMHQVNLQKGW